jgi:tetratricopeptide (TPR) repeat protein
LNRIKRHRHPSPVTRHALEAAALSLLLAAAPAAAGEAEWKMLYDQSSAHLQQGSLEQGELFAREALRESELLPEKTRATELSLLRAAHVLRLRGKADEALPLAERAVKISTQLHGAGSPNTAVALQIQAEVQSARRQYAAAEALHQKALAIFQKAYGERHMSVAVTLHNIGAMLYAQDKNKEAEKFLRRALAVKEQLLKPVNLSIAHTLDQLSIVLAAQGREIEAGRYKKRAEGIRQRAQAPKPSA